MYFLLFGFPSHLGNVPRSLCSIVCLHSVVCFMHACVCAKSLQSCLTLCDPVAHSPPGPSVHGILQARILEWVAMPSSRALPDPGIEPASLTFPASAGGFFTTSTTWKAPILYIVVFICQSQSPKSSCPLSLLFLLGIHMFALYICVSISTLQIRPSIQFF